MIDWEMLGQPLEDGSDTTALREHIRMRVRTEPFTLQTVERVLDFEPKNKPFLAPDPAGIPARANALLQAWPAGWRMAEDLLVALYPCHDPRYVGRTQVFGGSYGCKSPDPADFGHVYASTTSAEAFVEGIVSSLANWKLYGAGLAHEQWDRGLLDLPMEKTHVSPLRSAESVEPGAVIHIAYCMAHVLEYYEALCTLRPIPPGAVFQGRQARNRLVRSRAMLAGLHHSSRGGFDRFFDRFLPWVDRLLRTSEGK